MKRQERLHYAYQTAQKTARKNAEQHKANNDLGFNSSVLQPEERVLVKNVELKEHHKLADRWEHNSL